MRSLCAKCNRPLPVCLCPELPPEPIPTVTKVLILQHPHETRHKLATVPIISRCLSNCDVIVGRRLQLGSSQLLDHLLSIPSPHGHLLPFALSLTGPQTTLGTAEHSSLPASFPLPPPVQSTSESKVLDPVPLKNHSIELIKYQEPHPPSVHYSRVEAAEEPVPPFVVHSPSEAEDLDQNLCDNHSTEWEEDPDPSSSFHSIRGAAARKSFEEQKQELPPFPSLTVHSASRHECQDADPPAAAPLAGERDAEWQCQSCQRRKRVLLLFPTPFAVELRSWMSHQKVTEIAQKVQETEEGSSLESDARRDYYCEYGECSGGHVILLVVDGTWQHAREMVAASMPFLAGGQFLSVEQVCLPHDVTRDSEGLAIRKEPFAGCLTTIEAVARALAVLEPEPHGVRVQGALLSVLQRMVDLQAAHIFAPSKNPRPRPRPRPSAPALRRQKSSASSYQLPLSPSMTSAD